MSWVGQAIALCALLSLCARSCGGEWKATLYGETRIFPSTGAGEIGTLDASAAAEVEYQGNLPAGQLRARAFFRLDQGDHHRTHADLREALWRENLGPLEWKIGIDTVFWGVTEFDHLVDIVNQTDWVEDPRGAVKLGQPLASGSLRSSLGNLTVLLLPGFRKRTFPDLRGRLQTSPPTDPDHSILEARNGSSHLDWAARWNYAGSGWDLGVYRFEGTSRAPRFVPMPQPGGMVLIPRYDLITQNAIDGQVALGSWLWKIEAFQEHDQGNTYYGATGGFEYTLTQVARTRMDLGLVAELIRDHRPDGAAGYMDNDIALGLRVAANDTESTEGLIGWMFDRQQHTRLWLVDASRRLGTTWKLLLKARVFERVGPSDVVLYGARNDSYMEVGIARFL